MFDLNSVVKTNWGKEVSIFEAVETICVKKILVLGTVPGNINCVEFLELLVERHSHMRRQLHVVC
jgi:hypothetical protein